VSRVLIQCGDLSGKYVLWNLCWVARGYEKSFDDLNVE